MQIILFQEIRLKQMMVDIVQEMQKMQFILWLETNKMISVKLLEKLKEIYEDFGLDGLKQEINDLKLHTKLRCKVNDIIKLVLED